MKSRSIKVSELRPCDNCGGPIAPSFQVIRVSMALIKPNAVNAYLGMHQCFGGRAPAALVENFASESTDAVTVMGDKDSSLLTELFVCARCYSEGAIDLELLAEKRRLLTRTDSAQPCGCDPKAKWTCEQHRAGEEGRV